jgi:GntR family transcriptional repressor for pyruvate dehydrogenase complex
MNESLLRIDAAGSLPDKIYAHVVESILRGDYAQSGRLPTETVLATRFGVSRPTVREALSRLRSDGIVESRRGSGSYVMRSPVAPAVGMTAIKSMADIERYYAFRTCVEAGAAAGAAEFREAADIDAMRASFDALTTAMEGNRPGIDEDVSFHLAIARASHNQFFVSTIETSVGPIRQFMELAHSVTDKKDFERVREVQREHLAIVEAIVRRSPVEAAEAIRAHILAARRRIFEGTPLP